MKSTDIPAARGYLYIMSSFTGVLYTGMTSNLLKRVWEHKEKLVEESFTAQYNINQLLYFESFSNLDLAHTRETQIKKWSRTKKLKLIEKLNPLHNDLAKTWFE